MSYRDGNYDVPDPGTQRSATATSMVLTCSACAWRVSDASAMKAVGAAQAHVRLTGHEVRYRGRTQAFAQAEQPEAVR